MLKSNEKTCGFLYYAYNNEIINYLKLAISSALTGRYQLSKFNAMVVTNSESLASLNDNETALLNELFDLVKVDDVKQKIKNYRKTTDGEIYYGTNTWINHSRSNAYTDSIYDETIMIDVDFIFQDKNLDKLWGSNSSIMMNRIIIPIINKAHSKNTHFHPTEKMGSFSIPMYWATVVYFDRSEFSKNYFDVVNHIKENYFYFQRLYQVSDNSYRNDYSFSIALYIANGNHIPSTEWEIPFKFVLSTNNDVVYRVDKQQIKLMIHTHQWKNPKQLFNVENISLHCMNKVSMTHHYDTFVEIYS